MLPIPGQSIITHLHLTVVFHMQTFFFSTQGLFFYCLINFVIFHMFYFLCLELKLFKYLASCIYISVKIHTIRALRYQSLGTCLAHRVKSPAPIVFIIIITVSKSSFVSRLQVPFDPGEVDSLEFLLEGMVSLVQIFIFPEGKNSGMFSYS